MNNYTFEQIKVGLEVSFEYILTKDKVRMFKEITDDINPLHNDLEYAKSKGYQEKVVYGMLTSSILSTLAGVYLPGKYSLIHQVEISFIKPVFISSSPLNVIGKVVSVDERFKQIEVKYNIFDNNKNKVCRGIMKIGVTN